MKYKKIISIVVIILLVLFAGYLFWNNNQDLVKQQKKVVKIGLIIFKTGGAASYGEKVLNGINMALKKINTNNNKNEYKLILEDDQTKPEKAVSAINKIISTNSDISVIISALTSSSTLAIAPIAEKKKIVLFSPCSSSPEISNAGDFIFRNWPSDTVEGELIAKYSKEKGYKNIAIIYINNAYGFGLKEVFTKEVKKFGGNIVLTEAFNENNIDFKNIISKLSTINFDAIYAPSHAKEAANFIKTLRENNIDKEVLGCVTYESPDIFTIGKNSLNNVVFTTPWFDSSNKNEVSENFIKEYKAMFHEIPDNFAAQSYDALMIIKDAIEKEGNNSLNIKNYLYNLKNYPGVSGLTSFDKNGDVIKPALLKTIKNGKFVVLKELN